MADNDVLGLMKDLLVEGTPSDDQPHIRMLSALLEHGLSSAELQLMKRLIEEQLGPLETASFSGDLYQSTARYMLRELQTALSCLERAMTAQMARAS